MIRCRLPNKSVGGRVGTRKEHAEPTEVCREKRIHEAGAGEREAENRIRAGVARKKAESEHLANHQDRNLHAAQRLDTKASFHCARGQSQAPSPDRDRRDEDARARGRQPVDGEPSRPRVSR